MLKSSYYNATSLRKFIKEGRKGTLIYNKESGHICNGYIALVVDELVRTEVIKEFLIDSSFYWQNGSFIDSTPDITQFFKKGNNVCKGTPYFFESNGNNKKSITLKVFLDEDSEKCIDKKYTDILKYEVLTKSEATSNGGLSGMTFEYDGALIAFMLPIRIPEGREYKVAKVS